MSYITAILTAAIVNNYVLSGGFGLTSSLVASKNRSYSKFFICLAVEFVAVGLAAFGINMVIGAAPYLSYFAYMALIAIVSFIVDKYLNKSGYNLFLFLCLNSAVFALCLNANGTFVEVLIETIGAALGFICATVVMAGVRKRINQKYVPVCFKGLPIEILAAGIVALALYAFK